MENGLITLGVAFCIYWMYNTYKSNKRTKHLYNKRQAILDRINRHLNNSADYRQHYIETGEAEYLWYAMEENGKATKLVTEYERL